MVETTRSYQVPATPGNTAVSGSPEASRSKVTEYGRQRSRLLLECNAHFLERDRWRIWSKAHLLAGICLGLDVPRWAAHSRILRRPARQTRRACREPSRGVFRIKCFLPIPPQNPE